MTQAEVLRSLVGQGPTLLAPGIHDCLTALLAERAGFNAVFLGGNAATAAVRGLPDLGFLSAAELCQLVANVSSVLRIPLIVDADTGFGGPLQVYKTFRDLERAGAAGIQIEDQVADKRCGLLPGGHALVSKEEMVAKIRACGEARDRHATMIIARTLAFGSEGLTAAIDRGRAYKEGGADAVFVQVPGAPEELRAVRAGIRGPLVLNMDESTPASEHGLPEIEQFGFEVAIFPGSVRYAVVKAVAEVLATLKQSGSTRRVRDRMCSLNEYHSVLRLEEFFDLEQKLGQESARQS